MVSFLPQLDVSRLPVGRPTAVNGFLLGIASVLDFTGCLDVAPVTFQRECSDLEAIGSDWEAVGSDLRVAIAKHADLLQPTLFDD